MDWVQLHLALNHVPVMGTCFVLLLLIAGMVKQSEEIKRMTLWWVVILAAVSIPIKFTGDFAYEKTADETWMDESLALAHEKAADQATTGVFLLGVAAAVGLFVGRSREAIPTWVCLTVLLIGLATALLMARTAHLGGLIRHPEIRSTTR